VVTDDRALGQRVRALGARVVSASDFLARTGEAAGEAPAGSGAVDLGDWEAFFADDRNRLP
jgi:ABC-type cobalamin transport system permease subunit